MLSLYLSLSSTLSPLLSPLFSLPLLLFPLSSLHPSPSSSLLSSPSYNFISSSHYPHPPHPTLCYFLPNPLFSSLSTPIYSILSCCDLFTSTSSNFLITLISYRQICRRFYAGVIGPLYLPFLEFQRRCGRKQITTVGQAFCLLLREIPGI